MTKDGKMLPEEEKEVEELMKKLDTMEVPPMPAHLKPENLTPSIVEGLSYKEHKKRCQEVNALRGQN